MATRTDPSPRQELMDRLNKADLSNVKSEDRRDNRRNVDERDEDRDDRRGGRERDRGEDDRRGSRRDDRRERDERADDDARDQRDEEDLSEEDSIYDDDHDGSDEEDDRGRDARSGRRDSEEEEEDDGRPARRSRSTEELDDLRDEVADLRAQLRQGGRKDASSTEGDEEGTPDSSPADKKKGTGKLFERVRAKFTEHKEKWGDAIEDLGLNELVEDLESAVGKLTKADTERKRAEAQHQEAQKDQARTEVHRAFGSLTRDNPRLARLVGTGPISGLTRRENEFRNAVIDKALEYITDSQRLVNFGRRRSVISQDEAFFKACEYLSGEKLRARGDTDRQVRERVRMRTPARGGSASGGSRNTRETARASAISKADTWSRQHRA